MPLTLSSYSHGNFHTTGKVYHVTFAGLAREMQTIWDEVKTTNFPMTIQEVEHPGLHAVYFNMSDAVWYAHRSHDEGMSCSDKSRTHHTRNPCSRLRLCWFWIYRSRSSLLAWQQVNAVSREELPRKFGYDLEMYSEDLKKFTIAVSV